MQKNAQSGTINTRGAVAEWSNAEVCKTFFHRFKSDRHLQIRIGGVNEKFHPLFCCGIILLHGRVAELVYAVDLKSASLAGLWVQVPSRPPI